MDKFNCIPDLHEYRRIFYKHNCGEKDGDIACNNKNCVRMIVILPNKCPACDSNDVYVRDEERDCYVRALLTQEK